MNVSHQDYSPSCDPIFTYDNPECSFTYSSTATCPVMGSLLNVSSPGGDYISSIYLADKYKQSGAEASTIVPFLNLQISIVPVIPWCATGNAPDLGFITMLGGVSPYYDVLIKWKGVYGSWQSQFGWVVVFGTTDSTKGNCEELPGGNSGVTKNYGNGLPYRDAKMEAVLGGVPLGPHLQLAGTLAEIRSQDEN
jgi:hypothetical protein